MVCSLRQGLVLHLIADPPISMRPSLRLHAILDRSRAIGTLSFTRTAGDDGCYGPQGTEKKVSESFLPSSERHPGTRGTYQPSAALAEAIFEYRQIWVYFARSGMSSKARQSGSISTARLTTKINPISHRSSVSISNGTTHARPLPEGNHFKAAGL